mgnify:CR=1 FL=1
MTMQNQIDSMETSDHLAHLLAGSVLGQEFSEEDRRRLEGWLAESEEHRALFRRVKSLEMVRDIIHLNKEGYGGKMAARFRQERRKQERGRLVRRWIGWCGGRLPWWRWLSESDGPCRWIPLCRLFRLRSR